MCSWKSLFPSQGTLGTQGQGLYLFFQSQEFKAHTPSPFISAAERPQRNTAEKEVKLGESPPLLSAGLHLLWGESPVYEPHLILSVRLHWTRHSLN